MEALLAALKALAPVLEPVVMQEFEAVVMPELQKLEQGIGSPDLKILAAAFVSAFQGIAEKEIPAKL